MFSREARNTRVLVLRWKIHSFPVVTSNPGRNVKSSHSWFLLLSFLLQDHVIWLKTSLHCELFQHLSFTCYSSCCNFLIHWKISAQKCWFLSGMIGWMANWPLQLWFTTAHLYLKLMILCRLLIRGDCHSNVYSFPYLLPKDFLQKFVFLISNL